MINLTREEAQQVLDVLEGVKDMAWDSDTVAGRKLIETLRAKLTEPEPEPVAGYRWEEDYDAIANKQLASLKAAAKVTFEDAVVRAVHKLYNAPPQRESVYCGCGDEIVAGDGARCGTCVAVKYKEKEWVGLTDEEIIDTANMAPFETMVSAEDYIYVIARAIEAKLKEKNST